MNAAFINPVWENDIVKVESDPIHQAVLLVEAVEALVTDPDGQFVDCTYGRGGHSERILSMLSPSGRLLVIDKDDEAIDDAVNRFGSDSRVTVCKGSFADVLALTQENGLSQVDGILLDLGVSSPQLDDAGRGFSFMRDGPLDMRMDQDQEMTAAIWLAEADEHEIMVVLRKYGEEKFARRIAKSIIARRELSPLVSTSDLSSLIEEAVPVRERHKHPATRSFQAIRIFINRELSDLETCLTATLQLLKPGGRLVVISFHSLEDRIVKRFMRDKSRGRPLPSRLPVRDADIERDLRLVGKAVKAQEEEIHANRRSRSAVMRVAERLAI